MKKAIIVLTKAPSAGVKRRIAAEKGEEFARKVYESFLIRISKKITGFTSFVFVEPEEKIPEVKKLIKADFFFGQEGYDLGERMINAMNLVFSKGFDSIVLIGGDSPTMPDEFFDRAFSILEEKELVVGPTLDGGFYLIGSKMKLEGNLFDRVEWGKVNVLKQVIKNLKGKEISYELLPPWEDIDTVEDLQKVTL